MILIGFRRDKIPAASITFALYAKMPCRSLPPNFRYLC